MPLEAPPASGAIWFDNWILQATIAAFSGQRSSYLAAYLLNPLRSDSWRSPDAADSYVVWDMGQLRTAGCFGLMDVNFSAGATVRLRASDDSAQLVNAVWWDFPLYQHDDAGRILRWYLGTPSGGAIGPSTNPADATSARGRQFWGVRILPTVFGSYNITDDFFEIGVAWLGQHTNIVPQEGIRPRPRDPSNRTYAYGGALWTDPLRPYRELDLTVANLPREDFYDLEALLRKQGSTHTIVDLHANATDARLKRGGCLYGYFDSTPADGQIDSPDENSLRIRFEEARG